MRPGRVQVPPLAATGLLIALFVTGSHDQPVASATTPGSRTKAVIVQPSSPRPGSIVFVKWWVPEPMDNNGDGYSVTFHGPGGPTCSDTVKYGGGTSWNVRYNRRYEHRRAAIGIPPRRSTDPPPSATDTWCAGSYHGKVIFTDYPAGKKHGKHHTSRSCSQRQVRSGHCEPADRLVGRFSFSVR